MTRFADIVEMRAKVGENLGWSAWHEVTQAQVDGFADVTGDHSWLHTDVERARQGPFGKTIVHGFLTLSLVSMMMPEVFTIESARMKVNYGLDRVRFTGPVPVGDRVRLGVELVSVEAQGDAWKVSLGLVLERESSATPACVALLLLLVYE